MEYLERAFLRAKNLKPRAPREGIRGEDGPPHGFEVSFVLGSIRGAGFGLWDLGRGRACEGERGHGEGVRGRRSGVREGESAGEGEKKKSIYYICGTQMTKLGK